MEECLLWNEETQEDHSSKGVISLKNENRCAVNAELMEEDFLVARLGDVLSKEQ